MRKLVIVAMLSTSLVTFSGTINTAEASFLSCYVRVLQSYVDLASSFSPGDRGAFFRSVGGAQGLIDNAMRLCSY